MPGMWDDDGFKESGFASIMEFDATLTEVEDDVEGKFGTQKQFVWTNVELVDAGDDVVLENGTFTDWIKQSGQKGSIDEHMVRAYKQYKEENGLDGRLFKYEFLYGVPTRFKKQFVEYSGNGADGKPMAPGKYFAPIGPAGSAAPAKDSDDEGDSSDSDGGGDIPQKVIDAAVKYAGEGATETQIKQTFTKKAAGRKAVTDAGGITNILSAAVESGALAENGGVYAPPVEDSASDDEDDDLL